MRGDVVRRTRGDPVCEGVMEVRKVRAQCPGCLSAHRNAGLYCAACECALVVREVVKAGAIMASGIVAAALVWMACR